MDTKHDVCKNVHGFRHGLFAIYWRQHLEKTPCKNVHGWLLVVGIGYLLSTEDSIYKRQHGRMRMVTGMTYSLSTEDRMCKRQHAKTCMIIGMAYSLSTDDSICHEKNKFHPQSISKVSFWYLLKKALIYKMMICLHLLIIIIALKMAYIQEICSEAP